MCVLLLSVALPHGGLAGLRLLVFRGRSGSGRHIAAGKVSIEQSLQLCSDINTLCRMHDSAALCVMCVLLSDLFLSFSPSG